MNFIKKVTDSNVRSIFMNRGIYRVYVETPYIFLPYDEHNYLIETGESCSYVREYLTKKKIPIRYGKHFIYKDFYGNRKDTYKCKSNLMGPYQYPYYIEYNQVIMDQEYDVDSYKAFGI